MKPIFKSIANLVKVKKNPKMKTASELSVYLFELLKSCDVEHSAPKLYNQIKSGDLVKDFSIFTDNQSGHKSDDPSDPAAKDSPIIPDIDGRYYHTIRDITYNTFKSYCNGLSVKDFYDMTDENRSKCIKPFIDAGKITKDEVVNMFLSYCVWGTGNCNSERSYYREWYKTDLSKETAQTSILLDRIVDIRLYHLSKISNYNLYGIGWKRGVMAFWKLLNQYV